MSPLLYPLLLFVALQFVLQCAIEPQPTTIGQRISRLAIGCLLMLAVIATHTTIQFKP